MESIILLLIILSIIAFLIWNKAKYAERRGASGEDMVAAAATSAIQNKYYGRVLRNIYVPRDDGHTTEIDVLLICVKGIFVFESKNYAGYIFGNDQNRTWTVSLYAGRNLMGFKTTEKHSFYNPVWQNRTHIKALQGVIDTPAPFFSIVVFSDRGELKDVTYDESKVTILKSNQMKSFMQKVHETYPEVLSRSEVDTISNKLAQYAGVNDSVKLTHVSDIRKKVFTHEKCPWCGGQLIVRTAKKGPNSGKQFYGCSNYPKCKYTKNIQ